MKFLRGRTACTNENYAYTATNILVKRSKSDILHEFIYTNYHSADFGHTQVLNPFNFFL